MTIIHVGNFGRGWDNSICDELHISEALTELGHKIFNIQRETWAILPNAEPDFILLAQWDGFPQEFVPKLRNLYKCPIVFWCYDYQADGQEWHERLVAEADLYLSKRIADSKYPNWQWLSQDFAPAFLDKWDTVIEDNNYDLLSGHKREVYKDIDVLFTGSYLPWATERNETLKAIDEEFNLVIHSVNDWPGFKDQRGPIMDARLPDLYATAKIVLSIDHTIEAGYWSDRCAQAMACGAFVLHRYQPLASTIFHSYIGYFYDISTCLQSIGHWLGADEDRENLAAWGYEYAQKELKVRNRVEDLLNIVQEII